MVTSPGPSQVESLRAVTPRGDRVSNGRARCLGAGQTGVQITPLPLKPRKCIALSEPPLQPCDGVTDLIAQGCCEA